MHNSIDIKTVKELYNFPIEEINWKDISMFLNWTEEDIREWKDYIDWQCLVYNSTSSITTNLIREFTETFDSLEKNNHRYWDSVWGMIIWKRIIGDRVAKEFLDRFEKFDTDILKNQFWFSEEFIERFDNILDWNDIKLNKIVSKEFKEKYKEKMRCKKYGQ